MNSNFEIDAIQNLEVELQQIGPQGYSAYEIAVQHGFEGTEEEWLESLKGKQGDIGPQGPAPDMTNYYTKTETDTAIATAIGNAIEGSY